MLLEDNAKFELPQEYRESLVSELRTPSRRMSDDGEVAANISLDWQVLICNIIRDVLQGRPTNPGFLLSLRNCSQARLEAIFSVSIFYLLLLMACTCQFYHLPQVNLIWLTVRFSFFGVFFFQLCLQSLPTDGGYPSQNIKESKRFKLLKSFVQ